MRCQLRSRAGHTLLEVILALGLASLLVASLWVAIDLQLRATDTTRTHLEQAQLARAVLRRISDDLRSAVRYEPVDVQSLVSVPGVSTDLAASLTGGATGTGSGTGTSGGTGTGGATGTGGTGTGGTGGAGTSGTSGTGGTATSQETASETPAETPATSVAPKAIPGIYGDRYGLQIDVSRLPRLDQYEAFAAAQSTIRDKTSDVKSVAYYLGSNGPTASTSSATNVSMGQNSGGLVRRELDRAVTSWAAENGNLAGLDSSGQMLAAEVVALEFRYFDGTEWFDYWDSTEREGLPMAVDVALAIASQGSSVDQPWTGARTVSELEESHKGQVLIYRLIVHLPAARPTTLDATGTGTTNEGTEGGTDPAAATGDTASASGDSGSGSNGSGSASGTGTGGSQPSGSARRGRPRSKMPGGSTKTGTGGSKTGTPTGGAPTGGAPTGGAPTGKTP